VRLWTIEAGGEGTKYGESGNIHYEIDDIAITAGDKELVKFVEGRERDAQIEHDQIWVFYRPRKPERAVDEHAEKAELDEMDYLVERPERQVRQLVSRDG